VTRAKRKNPNRAGTDARKRKDGRYETRATPNTPTGRRRVSFYGATAEEANNKKFQALADQAKGILFSDPGRLTVVEYLQRWLTDTARFQVSEGTLERYERTCRNHLVPFFGRLRLRDLTAAHVRAFKARKIEEGLNPNTVGVMQGVLSTALNQAVDDDLIPSNFASRVKKAATRGRSPMRSLSQEEASRLLRAADGTRDEALMTLALRTGMRQGERPYGGRTSILPANPPSTLGARRTPARRRASPPPSPARSARFASTPAPSKSSRHTVPGSSRRGSRRPPGRTPAWCSRTRKARSAGATPLCVPSGDF
jgi:hypothetical protein